MSSKELSILTKTNYSYDDFSKIVQVIWKNLFCQNIILQLINIFTFTHPFHFVKGSQPFQVFSLKTDAFKIP